MCATCEAAGSCDRGMAPWPRPVAHIAFIRIIIDDDIPRMEGYQKNWQGSGGGLTVLVSQFAEAHAKILVALGFPLNPYTTCC